VTFQRTLLSLSLLLSLVGLAVMIIPATVSGMMGAPIEDVIATTCETFELAKQDLVRLVGGHTLSIGILCFFLRRIDQKELQGALLKVMVVACIPGLLAGMGSSLGWLPMSVSITALGLLLAGIYVQGRKPAPPKEQSPPPESESESA